MWDTIPRLRAAIGVLTREPKQTVKLVRSAEKTAGKAPTSPLLSRNSRLQASSGDLKPACSRRLVEGNSGAHKRRPLGCYLDCFGDA